MSRILIHLGTVLLQMAAFNIQEALVWKDKIEYVIDQVVTFGPHASETISFLPISHGLMDTGIIAY